MENVIKNKWNEIIEYLKDAYEVNGVLFRTWIEPLEVVSYDNDHFQLPFLTNIC